MAYGSGKLAGEYQGNITELLSIRAALQHEMIEVFFRGSAPLQQELLVVAQGGKTSALHVRSGITGCCKAKKTHRAFPVCRTAGYGEHTCQSGRRSGRLCMAGIGNKGCKQQQCWLQTASAYKCFHFVF